jgi:hypothetical protein
MNFSDRALLVFFMSVSSLIVPRVPRTPIGGKLFTVNGVCLVVIALLVAMRERSGVWRFLHDWYPMAMFIVCFEEVSSIVRFATSGRIIFFLKLEAHWFSVPPTVWLGQHGSAFLPKSRRWGTSPTCFAPS